MSDVPPENQPTEETKETPSATIEEEKPKVEGEEAPKEVGEVKAEENKEEKPKAEGEEAPKEGAEGEEKPKAAEGEEAPKEGAEGENKEGESKAEGGEGGEGETPAKKPRRKKKRAAGSDDDSDDDDDSEEGPPPPPKSKPPARAPPPPPPKVYDVDKDTWSSAPVSNRVWEVDEEQDYQDVPQEEEINLTDSPISVNYTIGNELGRGFYSTVKLITHKQSGKKFALKIVNKANAPQFLVGNIKSELDILSKLSHPNVIKGVEVHDFDNYLLVVLELAEGGEVANVLGGNPNAAYSEANVHRLAKQLVSAISHLHQNNIIHGDLAPENLFLVGGDDSDLKVGGFSGAVISGGGKESQAPIGNAEYQAPEIMMNQGFDKSSDTWSIGCLLYFLVNGTSPFKDSNTMRMNMKIRQGTFEFGDAWAKVSPSLKDLISKLIVTDPSKRLSADDVLKHPWLTSAPANNPLPNARSAMSQK